MTTLFKIIKNKPTAATQPKRTSPATTAPKASVVVKEMLALTPEEEAIYFDSLWYVAVATARRQRYIKTGLIVEPAWHKYNV